MFLSSNIRLTDTTQVKEQTVIYHADIAVKI